MKKSILFLSIFVLSSSIWAQVELNPATGRIIDIDTDFNFRLTDKQYNRILFQSGWITGTGDYLSIKHGGGNIEAGTYGLRISDGAGFDFGKNNFNTSFLKIKTNGNVGIGTSSPREKLNIYNGNILITSGLNTNNASHNGIQFTTDNQPYYSAINAYRGSYSRSIGLQFTTMNGDTNPIKAMNIDPLGNVGIGITNPGSRLDIVSNAGQTENLIHLKVSDAPTDYFRISNATGVANRFLPSIRGNVQSSNTSALIFVASTNAANDNNGSSGMMRFDTRRSSNDQGVETRPLFEWTNFDKKLMTIKANGNIGIGVTNPGAKLHVSSGSQFRKTTIGLTTASAENSFIRDEWLTGNYGPAKWDQTKQKWVRPGSTYNDIGGIVYQDEGTYFLRENRGTKLEYTNSEFLNTAFMFAHISTGNVGIGTNTPTEKLDVLGRIRASQSIDVTGISNPKNGVTMNLAYSASDFGLVRARDWNNNVWKPIHYQGSYHNFETGNVGIGTTTPDAKLAVNGNVHAKEVKIDLIGWPDYVFENTYELPSLTEVEAHIAEKGHLKNIPSAAEVEKNGILVGEMNKKLLEKIEELTLYTIAQEKEIKELQQLKTKNQELETRLAKLEALLIKK